MSVIVKGMEMPDCCGLCPCFHPEHPIYCQAVKVDRTKKISAPYGKPRPDWCPLVELPSHGRFIDADALLDESEWYGERATYDNPMPKGEEMVSVESILNAPTIFEEEQ